MKIKNYIALFVFYLLSAVYGLASNNELSSELSSTSNNLNAELKTIIETEKSDDDFSELYDVEPIESDLNSAKDIENIVKRHKYNKIQEDLAKRKKIDTFLNLNYKTQIQDSKIYFNSYDRNNLHLPKMHNYQSEAFMAVEQDNLNLLQMLLPYIELNKTNDAGKTLLDIAKEHNNIAIINFLTQKGAKIHYTNINS
ncbi:MAG: hypothetical protein ACK4OM_04005 [Alphaproteobacteria bacterium]